MPSKATVLRDKENGVTFKSPYHMTATERKFIKKAYVGCKNAGFPMCRINTFKFKFDFDKCTGYWCSDFETNEAAKGNSVFLPDADGEVKFPFTFECDAA